MYVKLVHQLSPEAHVSRHVEYVCTHAKTRRQAGGFATFESHSWKITPLIYLHPHICSISAYDKPLHASRVLLTYQHDGYYSSNHLLTYYVVPI